MNDHNSTPKQPQSNTPDTDDLLTSNARALHLRGKLIGAGMEATTVAYDAEREHYIVVLPCPTLGGLEHILAGLRRMYDDGHYRCQRMEWAFENVTVILKARESEAS